MARTGTESERLAALRRLDDEARRVEGEASGPPLDAFLADELRGAVAGGQTTMQSAPLWITYDS
jgi:hypothetical protein